jgi:hypothetical protein
MRNLPDYIEKRCVNKNRSDAALVRVRISREFGAHPFDTATGKLAKGKFNLRAAWATVMGDVIIGECIFFKYRQVLLMICLNTVRARVNRVPPSLRIIRRTPQTTALRG